MIAVRRLLLLPTAAVLAWLLGFAWFVHTAWSPTPPPPHADGIVVLTGGAERVQTGLRLLQSHAADRLLVSGVGRAAAFPQLAHLAGMGTALAPAVTLGRTAGSTRGNAAETADWVAENGIHTLIVVTAGYHMRRALTELRRALPDVTFYPAAVQPPGAQGLTESSTWRLLAGEYMKYLVASLGLTDWAGHLLGMEHAG